MPDIDDLEKRVTALEAAQKTNAETLNWVVGTLGRVAGDVSAVKEDVQALRAEFAAMRGEVREFKEELPGLVGKVVRESMRGES